MEEGDLCLSTEEGLLNLRVCAIIRKNGKILMAGNDHRPDIYTVGGRIKFGETAEEAVLREVKEETGVSLEIDRLAFIHENFYTGDEHYKHGKRVHEIAFFFYMKVNEDFEPVRDASVDEENLFWVNPDNATDIHPSFLKEELRRASAEIRHYVTRK